jgi:hypothetical protein
MACASCITVIAGLSPGMRMLSIPVPEIIERIWRDAPPGREATAVNELLRSPRELLIPREPPRWARNATSKEKAAPR